MKQTEYFMLVLFGVLVISSCSGDEEFEPVHSIVGEWQGKIVCLAVDTDDIHFDVDVKWIFSKNGRCTLTFVGLPFSYTSENIVTYTHYRADYTIENDTIWLSYDYKEEYSGDASYIDKREKDGIWYRYSIGDDDFPWDDYSDITYMSPRFEKIGKNKYKHVYLYGEDSWIYKNKLIWRMTSSNQLIICFPPTGEYEMYTLHRK